MADLDQLNDPNISTITISDNGQISASVAQLTTDATAIGDLQNANASPVLLAINDTAGAVQTGLSTLVQDTGEIGSITIPRPMTRSSFRRPHSWPISRRSTRSRGGSTSRMTAANLVADLSTLNADSGVDAITADIGDATLSGGVGVNAPNFSESGWGTSLTVSEALAYAGAFSQGSGSTLSISSGDTLSLTGTASLSGTTSGAGTLALAGGSATIDSGATISVSNWSISGAGTDVTLDENLELRGVVQRRRGRHVRAVGRPSPVERRRHVRGRDGGRLEVARDRGDDDGLRPDDRRDGGVGKHRGRDPERRDGDDRRRERRRGDSSTTRRRELTTSPTTAGSIAAARRPRISRTPACSRRRAGRA